MKKLAILICGAMLSIGFSSIFTSCDSKAKLAESIKGTWTGNPEKVLDTDATSASMVRALEFLPGASVSEGTVTMSAIITVENATQFNDSVVSPIQITASGTATVQGTYQVKDDDDIIISLDATSFAVNVDPDGVQLNYNALSESSAPIAEKLKPAAAQLATQQITSAARSAFSGINEIEDIHVHGSLMKCEINHRDLVFSRSAQ